MVATVLNTLPSFARVKEPVRFAIRNTQRHSMISVGNQKRWKRKVETANMRNQKPVRKKKKKTEERVVNVCTATCNVTDAGDLSVVMGIIPVWLYHKDNPTNKICVCALLDNASGGTFIREDSLRRLGVEGSESKLLLTTMHGTQEVDTKAVDGLMAYHFQENEVIVLLPRTYVRQDSSRS